MNTFPFPFISLLILTMTDTNPPSLFPSPIKWDILSHNIRGSQINPAIRSKFPNPKFLHYKNLITPNTGLFCMQEMHSRPTFQLSLAHAFPHLSLAEFSCSNENSSAGIATYFNPKHLTHISSSSLIPGRLSISKFTDISSSRPFLLVNIYGHTSSSGLSSSLFDTLLQHLTLIDPTFSSPLLVLGDFNINLSLLDSNHSPCPSFSTLLNLFCLLDIPLHLGSSSPTWVGPGQRFESQTRIDSVFSNFMNFSTSNNTPPLVEMRYHPPPF